MMIVKGLVVEKMTTQIVLKENLVGRGRDNDRGNYDSDGGDWGSGKVEEDGVCTGGGCNDGNS